MISHTAAAQFSRHFSEIEGLQKESLLSYYAEPLPNGVTLCVEETTQDGKKAESCVCPNLSAKLATNILQLACENNFGLGAWYDLLRDQEISFQIVPAN